jgi:hypothetical protein
MLTRPPLTQESASRREHNPRSLKYLLILMPGG